MKGSYDFLHFENSVDFSLFNSLKSSLSDAIAGLENDYFTNVDGYQQSDENVKGVTSLVLNMVIGAEVRE